MRILTEEERLKIEYLSAIFAGSSVEELKELAEKEHIVSKLKGNYSNSSIPLFNDLIERHTDNSTSVITLESEMQSLKDDLTQLIRVVDKLHHQPVYIPSELATLKSKYGAY